MGVSSAVVGGVASVVGSTISYKQAKKSAKQEANIAKQNQEREELEIKEKQKLYEQEKKNLLKEKIAAKKAKMAANGLDFTDGSSAVLLGSMEREVDEDIKNNAYFADLDLKANSDNYNYKKSKNLLKQKSNDLNMVNSLLKIL